MSDETKAKTVYSTLPMVECPHCGKTFQWDDYYDLKAGDDLVCQRCEKTIFCHSVDVITEAAFGTVQP